jgi:hypothetical protein
VELALDGRAAIAEVAEPLTVPLDARVEPLTDATAGFLAQNSVVSSQM